ncbi:MAG: SprT-like domain-containing protein [Nitrospirae bacterium]|nr:SprT-like domain-containing protein [Nitrospirota bacterium]
MNADLLKSFIERAAGRAIDLTITENSTSMLSMKHTPKGDISLRVHRMFLDASPEVLDEIADFVKHRKKKTPLIREYIRKNHHSSSPEKRRRAAITPLGKYHNLRHIYDALNEEYFNGQIAVEITWGRNPGKSVYRKRRLGSCDSAASLIRIHPALDKSTVPRYLVEYVVYHEMLHAALGIKVKNGRRSIHGREFKLRERLFRDFDRAANFLKHKKI